MKKAIISFVICALVGFGLGYLVFGVIMGKSSTGETATSMSEPVQTENATNDKGAASQETATTTPADQDNILSKKGCLGCHSVGALNLKGGQIGPDLSNAFNEVADKHGMPIEEFLKKPNSAVMSGVIGSNPLSADEEKQVLDFLKQASESNK